MQNLIPGFIKYGFQSTLTYECLQVSAVKPNCFDEHALIKVYPSTGVTIRLWPYFPQGTVFAQEPRVLQRKVTVSHLFEMLEQVGSYLTARGLSRSATARFLECYVLAGEERAAAIGNVGYSPEELLEITGRREIPTRELLAMLSAGLGVENVRAYDPDIDIDMYLSMFECESLQG